MLRLLPGISSLLISTLPVHSPDFFPKKNMSRVFPVLVVAKTGFCVVTQNKVGHPAHLYRQLIEVPMLSACGIQTVFLGWHFEIVNIIF